MPILQQYKKILNFVFKKYPEIQLGIIFGSAASGRLTEESDVDITISANYPLDHDRLVDILNDCERALKKKVDIVDLKKVTGIILQQILCNGEVFLKKSESLPICRINKENVVQPGGYDALHQNDAEKPG